MWRLGAKIRQSCDVMASLEHLLDKVIQPHPVTGHREGGEEEDPIAMAGDEDGAQKEESHRTKVTHYVSELHKRSKCTADRSGQRVNAADVSK